MVLQQLWQGCRWRGLRFRPPDNTSIRGDPRVPVRMSNVDLEWKTAHCDQFEDMDPLLNLQVLVSTFSSTPVPQGVEGYPICQSRFKYRPADMRLWSYGLDDL